MKGSGRKYSVFTIAIFLIFIIFFMLVVVMMYKERTVLFPEQLPGRRRQ